MKTFYLILAAMLLLQQTQAQMDERFYHPDKEWLNIETQNYEEIILQIHLDTLYSALIKPNDQIKATIIYFHGNGGNISKWFGNIKPLIDNGYQVCIMDYRGYGKSTGVPTHLNIKHDSQVLFDSLLHRDDIKNTPIIIYGASIGGQVATHLAKNNNSKLTALVLDGCALSFTDLALMSSPPEHHEIIQQYVTSPYSAKEDIVYLKDIHVLFIHSEEDFIPIQEAKTLYDQTQCSKEFWVYKGKHVEAPVKYPETFVQYINALLNP